MPGPDLLHRMVGSGLLVIGGGLNAWALAERDRRSTGSFDLERPEELLTSGPYAMTRHPMYVGWWLIHLGAGTLTGSSWVVVTLPVGMLMDHLGVLREEAALLEAFGRPYAEYEKRVHRYLGTRSRRR
ncbi:methyltransferase family protein [Paenarthrobacter sp. 2TAF44]|uniref:methyltransferase family protein n=1 Tax=Paenarthrobacter sp. 2TAF44 TaxID=3233018 RepID=UPI003F94FC51